MLKVYGIELSFPVNRVRLCANALELEYEFIHTSPLEGDTQTESYLKMHPAGKIPAIDDDGFTLFESNAIMKYLCRKHKSDLYPTDITAQAAVDKWLDFVAIHLANGMGKVLFNKLLAGMLDMPADEQSLKEGYGFCERFLGVIDKQLGTTRYLASNSLSIADFSLLATVDPLEVVEIDIEDYPNIKSWRDKLMQEKFYTDMHSSYSELLKQLQDT